MVPFHSGMSTCLLRSPVHASHEAWKWGQKQRKDTKRCLLSLSLAAAVCCNWISLPKHKANVPSSIQRDTARFQRSPPAVWWIFWFSFYWAGTPGLLLLHGKWIVPFPEALLDGFSGYVVWWEGVPFLLFFLFFCLRPLRHVLLAVCMSLGSVYVSSCHCPNIWAKVLQRRDSGIVSGSMFSCYAPSCDWGIVISEEGD